jgi:phospholipase C
MAITRQQSPRELVLEQEIAEFSCLDIGGAAMRRRDFLKLVGSAASLVATPSSLLAQPAAPSGQLGKIDHFVVLMLENRSFDSMLGMLGRHYENPGMFDGLMGTETNPDADGRAIPVTNVRGTSDDLAIPNSNPAEQWQDINEQLFGVRTLEPPTTRPTMDGFVKSYMRYSNPLKPRDPTHAMHYYVPQQLPVLSRLALEFAVCDRWFASAPTETWPNRFFLHTGTAKDAANPSATGYEDNLYEYSAAPLFGSDSWWSWATSWLAVVIPYFKPETLAFSSPSIFGQLDKSNLKNPWKLYYSDFPHASTILDVASQMDRESHFWSTKRIVHFEDFLTDCKDGTLPSYSVIEPSYYLGARNDQHPPKNIAAGEELIATVYNALRAGPQAQWLSTMLIIIYDEHGGTYDHVPPPPAVPPDSIKTTPFNFDRYGVRVPAVIVSPYIRPRTILRPLPEAQYPFDHTSIIATLRKRFSLGSPLTKRDEVTPDLESVLNLEQPSNLGPETLTAGDASWFAR